MSNIWCHFVFREYWFWRVCGLCKHFCIGCKAMFTWHCKVCLMHGLMKCEIWWVSKFCCLSFVFILTLLQRLQRHSEIRKTPGKSCWHMGFCDWDDCNKTGKVSFSISAVTSGGLFWVQWKGKNMRVVWKLWWNIPPIKVGQHPHDKWIT